MPKDKNARHLRRVRQARVRKKVSGTPERPRLSVFRSLKHIYAQVIDDTTGRTICRRLQPGNPEGHCGSRIRHQDGRLLQRGQGPGRESALAAGVTRVVFDRGGCKYHGRVKALADGSREGGLQF